MEVNITSIHFHADAKLKDFINEKLTKLIKFYDKLLSVDVFLKLENTGQVRDKIVELKAQIPGKTLLATSIEKSFESSLDVAQENIIRQLKKNKEKLKQAS